MKKTVIMHFYNESRMLKWWLSHHVNLFDEGILINHNSSDDSVDICTSIAPHWKIVNTELSDFNAAKNDTEVMRHEASVDGWKMVLNATEFLVCDPKVLDESLKVMQLNKQLCLRTRGVVMVDSQPEFIADPSVPLVVQKHHGYIEDDCAYFGKSFSSLRTRYYKYSLKTGRRNKSKGTRNRIIHAHETGAYYPGRHNTKHRIDFYAESIFTFWYGFSPWDLEMIERKQQFQSRIPREDREAGFGAQHLWGQAQLQDAYIYELGKSKDMSSYLCFD